MVRKIVLITFSLFFISGCQLNKSDGTGKSVQLYSPDKRIAVSVKTEGRLSYSVKVDGKNAITESGLALQFADGCHLGESLIVVNKKVRTVNEKWKPVWGKSSPVRNNYRELTISMKQAAEGGRRFDLIVRAYNDGVAFRYFLPEQKGLENFILVKEQTEFNPAGNPDCWAADFKSFYSHQEAKYPKRSWQEITKGTIWGVPLLMKLDESLYAAITEANIDDWAGMYLAATAKNEEMLFNSGAIKGSGSIKTIDIPVKDYKSLRIVIEPVDVVYDDRAVLADAKFTASDGSEIWLSDIEPMMSMQKVSRNKNSDDKDISLAGKKYEKGIGSFSRNEIVYNIDGKYESFKAVCGIDDASKERGLLRIEVYGSKDAFERINGLASVLSPLPDSNGRELVRSKTPHYSPWRVIMLGRKPGELIESNLIVNLNPSCAIKDTSWIKPGIMVWDHWWSGEIKMDTPTIKEYIQFAADMKFPFMLIDWGWYGDHDRPDADVTRVTKSVDMQELLRFAKERNVKLWVWVYWTDLERKLEEAFALYEKWGLAGVKIDFMQRDDQEMVNWYEKVIRTAAKHHLMIDFHGAYKPDGIRRTWPNMMTREGVLGNEWNKWYDFMTAEHNVTLPFTRMLAGPMDYTPGGFLNVTKENWKPGSPTKVQTTRCQQLAMLVVYETPITCICDHPKNYYNQKGLEFMKNVPSSWDETKVINGEVGKYITIARRAGKSWYVGAMTDLDGRTLEVPLDFLGKGKFKACIFFDATDADKNPEKLIEETLTVTAGHNLTIRMAPSGGFAASFEPEK